jgi:hypothetical protein
MAKLDWKRGRFNSDWETKKMFHAMEGWRTVYGDTILYYKFNDAASTIDPVYDEASITGGRAYYPALAVPCQHVIHVQGANEYGEYGMYYNDELDATISFAAFTGAGLRFADIETGNYLDDRVVYDRKVFRVTQILVRGQIQQRDVIIALRASQMKPDELVDDPLFSTWAQGGPDDNSITSNTSAPAGPLSGAGGPGEVGTE